MVAVEWSLDRVRAPTAASLLIWKRSLASHWLPVAECVCEFKLFQSRRVEQEQRQQQQQQLPSAG